MSFSESVTLLSVVTEFELVDVVAEGIFTLVFVLRVARVCGVAVVRKVDTDPADKMSLLVCVMVVVVAPPFGNSRMTFFSGKMRSLSSFNIASISRSACVTMHFCDGSHQVSLARSSAVSVKNLLSLVSSIIPCQRPLR